MESKNMAITVTVKKMRYWQWTTYLFYPTGVLRVWQHQHRLWVRVLYTLVGLPFFLALTIYFSILVFASFYPPLDTSVGNRADRTVFNSDGNYRSTFVKSGHETGGAYELIQVELEPHGGNGWHYHKKFDEFFTVLKGKAIIGKNGKEFILNEGDSAMALKGELHFFANPTDSIILLQVRVTPAMGLEKSIRVAYGLANDGQFEGEMTENPWHMALLLGYSGTYLPGVPGFIQEPLINSLAKIAQGRGEDKTLEKYFR